MLAMELKDDSFSPRSNLGTSPRDDRFYTPRSMARSDSTSNSDEWASPRFETPRVLTGRTSSDGEFVTPRTPRLIDADVKPSIGLSQGRGAKYMSNTDKPPLSNVRRHSSRDPHYADSKDSYGNSPRHYGSAGQHYENGYDYKYGEAEDKKNDEQYVSLDMEDEHIPFSGASGITEKDVEDIFSYARHGRCPEIENLLSAGIPVDVKDMHGNTLLTIACQNGNKRVAKAVLRRGANINARNFKGNTPLHYCYHYGYGDTLGQYLISKGADPHALNKEGIPPYSGI